MAQPLDSTSSDKVITDTPIAKPTQSLNAGAWSDAEDRRLKEGVSTHGTRWIAVAELVGTRNGEQCAKRWKDNVRPGLDHSPWSPEQDNFLLNLVTTEGHNWKLMSEKFLQGRSPLSIKNRYSLLMRRQKRHSKQRHRQQKSSSSPDELFQINTPSSETQPPFNLDITSINAANSLLTPEDLSSTASSNSAQPYTGTVITSPKAVTTECTSIRWPNFFPDLTQLFPNETTSTGANAHDSGGDLTLSATLSGFGQNPNSITPPSQGLDNTAWLRRALCSGADNGYSSNSGDGSAYSQKANEQSFNLNDQFEHGLGSDKGLEFSVTCTRSMLKAMVCHIFEGAMSQTAEQSDEQPVTVTLSLKR